MNRILSGERGNALITALMLSAIMLASAVAVVGLVNGEQSDSRRERERESSFQLAEGVLNAQIYQLSTRWPGKYSTPYPASCIATSGNADCPGGTTLQSNFTGVDYTKAKDWKVQVFDNGGATPNYYSESLAGSTVHFDENDDNFLWVRATATVSGRKRTLVALVEAENVTLNCPTAAVVAGHFAVTNKGNKTMIDTNGESNQFTPGDIIVRCNLSTPNCATWDSGKDQVSPNTVRSNPSQPPAVSPEALDQLRARAVSEGNYYAAGECGALAGDQPGELVSSRTRAAASTTRTPRTTASRSRATSSSPRATASISTAPRRSTGSSITPTPTIAPARCSSSAATSRSTARSSSTGPAASTRARAR
jgi:hypothetical protein